MRAKQVPEVSDKTGRRDSVFAAVMTVLFSSALLIAMLHHEMWRDEIMAWMLARGIHSIGDFIRVIDWEPHPATWYLCVMAVAKIFASPFSIQALNLVIASCAAYVLLRYAPLPRAQKGLLVFGFFTFFEYGVISRDYGLGLLLAYVFCALFPYRSKHLIGLAGVLFLLANTSALGMILALSLGLTLLAAWYFDLRSGNPWQISHWRAILTALIVASGAALCALQVASPGDVGLVNRSGHNYFHLNLVQSVSRIGTVYLYNFGKIPVLNGFVCSLALLAVVTIRLRCTPVALFAYLAATALLVAGVFTRQIAFLWHTGHLFIIFIVSLWLAGHYAQLPWQDEKQRPVSSSARIVHKGRRAGASFWSVADKLANCFVYVILIAQLIPCAYAVYADYTQPYSCGKEAAEYIRSNGMADMTVAGDLYDTTQTISGYLGKPVYYLSLGENGVLSWWGDYLPPDEHDLSAREYARRAWTIAGKHDNALLLVLNYPLAPLFAQQLGATYVNSFEDSIGGLIQDEPACYENYWLYIVSRK